MKLLPPSDFVRPRAPPGYRYRRHVRHGRKLFDRRAFLVIRGSKILSFALLVLFFVQQLIVFAALSAQSQSTHYFVVALNVRLLQVIEQTPSLRDHLQQAAAGMIVLLVYLEMLGEFVDSLA